MPQASRIAVLIDPTMSAHQLELRRLPEAGRQLGVELIIVEASRPDKYEAAFEKAHAQGAEAIHVLNGPLPYFHSGGNSGAGGTLSIAGNIFGAALRGGRGTVVLWYNGADILRRGGAYVDKI